MRHRRFRHHAPLLPERPPKPEITDGLAEAEQRATRLRARAAEAGARTAALARRAEALEATLRRVGEVLLAEPSHVVPPTRGRPTR